MAQIIPLGFVTASNASLLSNIPTQPGISVRCNKVLVQAVKTADANDYVVLGLCGLNKTTGDKVIAVLQSGQSAVIGDERNSNVLDPTALAVDSISGSAVITGLLYQR